MNISIVPKSVVANCTYTAVQIMSVIVTPNSSACINVAITLVENDTPQILPNNITPIYKTLMMTGTDYSNWGTNDQYLITWVLTQLGFTQA